MSAYQTYLKDCDCSTEGIIIYNNKAVCRRCRKPYAQGGVINYEKEHFEEVKLNIPLFTTEDGVQIFEGDSVYSVSQIYLSSLFHSSCGIKTKLIANRDNLILFSKKEAAEEYILLNKPIEITQKEIMGAIKSACSYTFITIDAIAELFKSKIKL